MVRHALIAVALPILVSATAASAQDGTAPDQIKLGEQLVNQSRVVCHFAPQITSGSYAPALSKDSLGGKADIMHEVIADGTEARYISLLERDGNLEVVIPYSRASKVAVMTFRSDADLAALKQQAGQ